eukprot:CAMPEP_0172051608 /NCGR_PEP_ID=MMETSP1043-20130122/3223_1 /TAXON_ID=464988 /ORGANISM="Hemiselmis andersenii, Strain CCMP441" /LENGTH=46 /DNA_ID= /DNA_START= /DNA_END= /DNA_ORIENTATION=
MAAPFIIDRSLTPARDTTATAVSLDSRTQESEGHTQPTFGIPLVAS